MTAQAGVQPNAKPHPGAPDMGAPGMGLRDDGADSERMCSAFGSSLPNADVRNAEEPASSAADAGACSSAEHNASLSGMGAQNACLGAARLYDLHCHLGFFAKPNAAARELAAAGVAALSATVSPADYERAAAALADAPNVRVGVGLHPWLVEDGTCGEADVARAVELAGSTRYVAEVGLDFAHGRDASASAQLDALDRILAACGDGDHVLSVHAVRAGTPLLDLLERHRTCTGNRVVLHWFSGTSEELGRALRMGCLLSVGTRMLATRRGREYARQIPIERLLLETDLPGSAAEGSGLTPAELVRQLRRARATLCDLHGPDAPDVIAATSAELLRM